jgi:drug/metabolite transporter (DMT)-like permease
MPVQDHVRGALCLTAAAFLFAVMAALIKVVSTTPMSNEGIVFYRNLFGLVALLPWLIRRGVPALSTGYPALHLLRSTAGLASMYCFFFAIGRLPLGDVMVLNYTAPLFVPLMALLWLHESVAPRLWAALSLGFVGIVLTLKPGLGIFSPVALVGLASGLLAAVSVVTIRRMARHEPSTRIVFYYSAISTGLSLLPLLWAWQRTTLTQLALMAVIGLLATGGQLFLTQGYSLAPAARVGPFMYAAVVFATLFGWVFWREVPDGLSFAGAALVCIAGVVAVRQMDIATAPADANGDHPHRVRDVRPARYRP